MADDTQIPIPEATTTETAAPSQEDARLEHATGVLEKKLGTPSETPAPKVGATTTTAPPPAGDPTETRRPATESWHDREQRRRDKYEREATARVLARIEETLNRPPEETAPESPEDPEPDFDQNPKAWYDWKDRQLENRIAERLMQAVQPAVEYAKQAGETQRQYQERMAEEQRRMAWNYEQAETMREAEALYLQTPEGQGYHDRLLWYGGFPGDPSRNLPPIDGAMARGLIRGGIRPEKARQLVMLNLQALSQFALDNQVNPAVLIDSILREELESVQRYSKPAEPQTPRPRASHPAARAGNQEIKDLNATAAAAASVSGSVGQRTAGKPTNGKPPVRANVSREEIEAWIKEHHGGDRRAGLKALREAATAARV